MAPVAFYSLFVVIAALHSVKGGYTNYAVCNVAPDPNYTGNKGQVTGQVLFRERCVYFPFYYKTDVAVRLTGFTSAGDGNHGFHVHQYGDLSNGCASCGGHFNPFRKKHGAPTDWNRHVGDLGNVLASGGVVNMTFIDTKIALYGSRNILGRGIVVHHGTDDLGLGGFPDSKTTGHAGARMGCCTIAATDESLWAALA